MRRDGADAAKRFDMRVCVSRPAAPSARALRPVWARNSRRLIARWIIPGDSTHRVLGVGMRLTMPLAESEGKSKQIASMRKAVEGYRTTRRSTFTRTAGPCASFWAAPDLWRFRSEYTLGQKRSRWIGT